VLKRADGGDLGELGNTAKQDAAYVLLLARLVDLSQRVAGAPVEIKRGAQVAGREAAFFGKPLGRQVIKIAVGRDLVDLDEFLRVIFIINQKITRVIGEMERVGVRVMESGGRDPEGIFFLPSWLDITSHLV